MCGKRATKKVGGLKGREERGGGRGEGEERREEGGEEGGERCFDG